MWLFDLFFPKRCVSCGRWGAYLCAACRSLCVEILTNEAVCPVCHGRAIGGATHPRCRTRYTPDGMTSIFRYKGPVRKLVKAIKYRRQFDICGEFVASIPAASLGGIPQMYHDGVLIPIPLHAKRFRERGFNQAEILGGYVAGRLGISMTKDVLVRTKYTTPQVSMRERVARLGNVRGAFIASKRGSGAPASVIVFDDVCTTGATVLAATNALKRAGVQRVWVVTMAR